MVPFNPDELTSLNGKKKLEAVDLIKKKCCGYIKGSICTNGSKQRKYVKPDESIYSPISSTETLMANLVIDVMEQRDVSIFDVQGDFLQTALTADKFLLMQIKDGFMDMMSEVNPEYIP